MKRPRFPAIKIREDGTKGCRGCGGVIPKGRLTWCSHECHLKFDPYYVKTAVRNLAHNKCEMCATDLSHEAQYRHRQQQPKFPTYEECRLPWPYDYNKLLAHPLYEAYLERKSEWEKAAPRPEYDHIIPHSEGGLFTVENIRLLCRSCHLKRTAEWRRSRKKAII